MTLFHIGQLLLTFGVLALIGRRVHEVFFVFGRFDARYSEALMASLRGGDVGRARALAAGGGPAWEARLARAGLEAYDGSMDVGAFVDEVMTDVRFQAGAGLRSLRVLGSIGSASGLMGACVEFVWLMAGDHGLSGLMAGRPQEMATARALLAVAIGFSVMIVALAARSQLGREGRVLLARSRKLAAALDRWGQRVADAVPADPREPEIRAEIATDL